MKSNRDIIFPPFFPLHYLCTFSYNWLHHVQSTFSIYCYHFALRLNTNCNNYETYVSQKKQCTFWIKNTTVVISLRTHDLRYGRGRGRQATASRNCLSRLESDVDSGRRSWACAEACAVISSTQQQRKWSLRIFKGHVINLAAQHNDCILQFDAMPTG